MIDKAEVDFPEDLIQFGKRDYEYRLMAIFGAAHMGTRSAVRVIIEPLLKVYMLCVPSNEEGTRPLQISDRTPTACT